MNIRKETTADIDTIVEVTIEAFKTFRGPPGEHTEQFIIGALRDAGALSLSLVAEDAGHIIGHIAFSPVTISDGSVGWYGVGPISVIPEWQGKGVGTALMHEGLTILKNLGAQGCALVGDPDYYKRFGYENAPGLIYEGIPQEYFMVKPFTKTIPQGVITFHEGFGATS